MKFYLSSTFFPQSNPIMGYEMVQWKWNTYMQKIQPTICNFRILLHVLPLGWVEKRENLLFNLSSFWNTLAIQSTGLPRGTSRLEKRFTRIKFYIALLNSFKLILKKVQRIGLMKGAYMNWEPVPDSSSSIGLLECSFACSNIPWW